MNNLYYNKYKKYKNKYLKFKQFGGMEFLGMELNKHDEQFIIRYSELLCELLYNYYEYIAWDLYYFNQIISDTTLHDSKKNIKTENLLSELNKLIKCTDYPFTDIILHHDIYKYVIAYFIDILIKMSKECTNIDDRKKMLTFLINIFLKKLQESNIKITNNEIVNEIISFVTNKLDQNGGQFNQQLPQQIILDNIQQIILTYNSQLLYSNCEYIALDLYEYIQFINNHLHTSFDFDSLTDTQIKKNFMDLNIYNHSRRHLQLLSDLHTKLNNLMLYDRYPFIKINFESQQYELDNMDSIVYTYTMAYFINTLIEIYSRVHLPEHIFIYLVGIFFSHLPEELHNLVCRKDMTVAKLYQFVIDVYLYY